MRNNFHYDGSEHKQDIAHGTIKHTLPPLGTNLLRKKKEKCKCTVINKYTNKLKLMNNPKQWRGVKTK